MGQITCAYSPLLSNGRPPPTAILAGKRSILAPWSPTACNGDDVKEASMKLRILITLFEFFKGMKGAVMLELFYEGICTVMGR